MPVIVVSLPFEPVLSSTSWAWCIALFVASLATISRLPFCSFSVFNKPLIIVLSSFHAKAPHQIVMEERTASASADLTVSSSNEAVLMEQQAGVEEENPSNFLDQQTEAAEEDFEAEQEEEVPPSWVSSLFEASETPLQAPIQAFEANRPCIPCSEAAHWSQSLHRDVRTRLGMNWCFVETSVGMPLHHQASLPCVAENFCSRVLSCQHSDQRLKPFQFPSTPSTLSDGGINTHGGFFARDGDCGGEVSLWDLEKNVCVSRLHSRTSLVTSLLSASSYARVAIAAGPHTVNQNSSVVTVWDDRCGGLHSASFSLPTAVTALGCRAQDLGLAGGKTVSMHDLRMLTGNPIFLHEANERWSIQAKTERGAYVEGSEGNTADELDEEGEEFLAMEKEAAFPSANVVDAKHANSRRRSSFIVNCLSYMCGLLQNRSAS